MTAEGSGICRIEGMAVFVPGTAVGDRCAVRIVKVLRKYAFGRLEKLLAPLARPHRAGLPRRRAVRRLRVPAHPLRSGASDQDAARARRARAHRRPAGFSDGADPRRAGPLPLPQQVPASHRPFEGTARCSSAFTAVNSHRIVNTESCLLQPEAFDRAAAAFRRWYAVSGESVYDEASHSGVLRHLYMRRGEMSGEMMVCVVANGAALHEEALLVEMLREGRVGNHRRPAQHQPRKDKRRARQNVPHALGQGHDHRHALRPRLRDRAARVLPGEPARRPSAFTARPPNTRG